MKALKIVAMVACVLMLASCGTQPPKHVPQAAMSPPKKLNLRNAQDIAGATVVQRDDYNNATKYKGPDIANSPWDQLFVRALKTDSGIVTYQVCVVISYSGAWRFYNNVQDTKGDALYLADMTRNLGNCQRNDCSHNEHLEIDVTEKYLEKHMRGGLRFKVSGKAAKEEMFFIPSYYIKAFLSLPD